MAEPRLIKKYANRRLYDTETSSYITLDGLHDLIVAGHDVKIIDDPSGKDISRSVLLQIIAGQEESERPMFETELLQRMIRMYGKPMQDLAGEFLSKSFDAFLKQQALYQEQMQKAMANTPFETINKLTAENLKAFRSMQEALFGKSAAGDKDETE